MIFGAGIGGGYGAFDCSKDFMHFSVNENSKKYLGIDFSTMLESSPAESKDKAPADMENAMQQVEALEEKAKKEDS